MSPVRPALIACVVCSFVATGVTATVIRVPADQPTIASALSIAVLGDSVLVSCGTYSESGLVLPAGVALIGDSSDSTCAIIQGNSTSVRILTMSSGSSLSAARKLTFRGGRATTGAAIFASSSVTIANCRFEDNRATSSGGAIRLSTAGQVTNCEFVDNRGTSGGAIICTTAGPITSCTFLRNRGTDGGALYVVNGDVGNCLFEGNRGSRSGGGAFVENNGNVDIHHCAFRADSADMYGGGLYSSGNNGPRDCSFTGNRASLDGGGLFLVKAATTERCTFLNNVAIRAGGGYAKTATSNQEAIVRSCTFYGNASPTGGGVAGTNRGAPRLERCVIQGSTAGGAFAWGTATLTPSLECCDLYGNTGGDWTGTIASLGLVNGNFSANALFCDVAGEATVSSASPLLAANNECGVDIGAKTEGCVSEGIVVTTIPAGLSMEVDGAPSVSPTVFDWSPGSIHTIGTSALHAPATGVQDRFLSWSDGGALSHDVSAPGTPTTFVASFAKEYLLTMEAVGGSVTPPTGWYAAQQPITIAETPNTDYLFEGWTGTGLGSYTGSATTTQLLLRAPITERANFSFHGVCTVTLVAAGEGGTVSITPPGGAYPVGTHVTIRASHPATYVFLGWTGEGTGSYTGPDSVKTITLVEPIVQTATFQYVGYVPLTMQMVGSGTLEPGSGDIAAGWPTVIAAYPSPGYAFHRWVGQGSGSYTGLNWSAFIFPSEAITQTAVFAEGGKFPLTMSATQGGTIFPLSGDRSAGLPVVIGATVQTGWRFREWQGTGYGSYSGPLPATSITMHGPITQHAVFEPDSLHHGYEFSISSSDTDPSVHAEPASGGYRSLYLWLLCGRGGLAALESGVSSTMPVLSFMPAEGVYDAESGPDLLLAVGGCPGESGPRLLGSWVVEDTGGEICLGPSAINGTIGAVDCGTLPAFWTDPRVYGFSSSGAPPCVIGSHTCESIGPISLVMSQLEATVQGRAVTLSWLSSAEVNHAGFHVYRSALGYDVYQRLTTELLVGANPHEYVDWTVESDHTYFYKVGALDAGGEEVLYGPVAVTTPRWAPLVTSLAGVAPNPFRGSTQVRFSLASRGRAKLTLYDVAGRRVAVIRDGEMPAGEHVVDWNGRMESGGPMASGVYFLRFQAGEKRQTQRVVVLGGTR